jgi:Protein of unknown function (DUF2845)
MNRTRLFGSLSLALVLLLGLPQAAWAFRCGTRLVSEGDTASEVRAKCGPPTEVSRRYIQRAPVYWHGGYPVRLWGGDLEVPVETWIYNLGSTRLMRQLRLEDGVVVEIDTLGYGY